MNHAGMHVVRIARPEATAMMTCAAAIGGWKQEYVR